MKLPLRLRKRPDTEPATALLLTAATATDLLDLCIQLKADPLPRTYHIAEGFLLLLDRPTSQTFPHVVRLRRLADHLFLPVDADLVPPLRADEAAALVRQRGLVFLPGKQAQGFALDQPVPICMLLDAGPANRRDWQPFPELPKLAERLESVTLDMHEPPIDDILDAGRDDVATEDPKPADTGVLDAVQAKVASGVGKGLLGLGKLLGVQSLQNLGAKVIESAVEMRPVLSESILGKQEAALRELLREFREGDLDKALRRALPLGGEGGRGSVPASGSKLPQHSLFYSLRNLLGAGGRASIWFGGYDVQAELAKEYRKAAEQAAERGDFRRAAFIYGRLMHDYRAAANVLFKGGLYHDAALIYLQKLNDRMAAAGAFEAAGEIDRAVQLYRQMGDHVRAGDVLKKVGEVEAALVEYRIAADVKAAAGDHLWAGNLMLDRAERSDLAEEYWENGWKQRPVGNAVPCGLRLLQLNADRASLPRFLELTREGRQFFEPPGNDTSAGEFFTKAVKLVERPLLEEARDDVRDLSLLGLAHKLRQRASSEGRPGNLVSSMFGQSGAWPAPVTSDAAFAVSAITRRPEPVPVQCKKPATTRLRVGVHTVTAVCSAWATGDVFIGFENGEVVCFRPKTSETVRVAVTPQARRQFYLNEDEFPPVGSPHIAALGTDGMGQKLFVHWVEPIDSAYDWLGSARLLANGTYERLGGELVWGPVWLSDHLEIMVDRDQLRVDHRYGRSRFPPPFESKELVHGRLWVHSSMLLLFGWESIWYCPTNTGQSTGTPDWGQVSLGWVPAIPKDSTLKAVPLAWLEHGNSAEVVGLSEGGVVHWSTLERKDIKYNKIERGFHGFEPSGHQAATIIRPGLIAAVTEGKVRWLGPSKSLLSPQAETDITLTNAVACFPSYLTSELIVVSSDGMIERVPIPV